MSEDSFAFPGHGPPGGLSAILGDPIAGLVRLGASLGWRSGHTADPRTTDLGCTHPAGVDVESVSTRQHDDLVICIPGGFAGRGKHSA